MRNKLSKKVAMILILPVFLATTVQSAFAADLIIGTGGQVQAVVSPDQLQTNNQPQAQAPEDRFEAGALSAPSATETAESILPEGWTVAPSHSNYAFKVEGVLDARSNYVWTLKLLKISTNETTNVDVQNGWPSNPYGNNFDVSPDGETVVYKVSYSGAINKTILQRINDSSKKLELNDDVMRSVSFASGKALIETSRIIKDGSYPKASLTVNLAELKVEKTRVEFVNPGTDVRVDNDRPYVTQLVRHWYSNNWTLYVYDSREGLNSLRLIHSQSIYTGQAGGSSALSSLDVIKNFAGQDILNISISSTQVPANLSINLTSASLPAGVNIPGTFVDVLEDDRIAAYVYLDAKGRRQAVIYDKGTKKVISQTQRVNVDAYEQVIFFDAPKIDNPPGRSYILHLDKTTQKLTPSSGSANQIHITPNNGKIIFVTSYPDGDSEFGIYQVGTKTLYMDSIHQWGLGATIIWNDPNNQYVAVTVGGQGHVLFISLSTESRRAFTQPTYIYNQEYSVVKIPEVGADLVRYAQLDFVSLKFNLAAKTVTAVLRGGDELLFNITQNGRVYLRQVESWQEVHGKIREYTKIIFGADGKRNSLALIRYDAKGRIILTRDIIYDANGKVKKVTAYKYVPGPRGGMIKVAI